MRVQPVGLPSINRVIPTVVNPVRSVTQAPRSGIRPEDFNNLLKMAAYNRRGQPHRGMVNTLSELFNGFKIDTKA